MWEARGKHTVWRRLSCLEGVLLVEVSRAKVRASLGGVSQGGDNEEV